MTRKGKLTSGMRPFVKYVAKGSDNMLISRCADPHLKWDKGRIMIMILAVHGCNTHDINKDSTDTKVEEYRSIYHSSDIIQFTKGSAL